MSRTERNQYERIIHELKMIRWELHIKPDRLYYIDVYNNVWDDDDEMNKFYMPEELLDDDTTDWVYEDGKEVYGQEILDRLEAGEEFYL